MPTLAVTNIARFIKRGKRCLNMYIYKYIYIYISESRLTYGISNIFKYDLLHEWYSKVLSMPEEIEQFYLLGNFFVYFPPRELEEIELFYLLLR